MDDKSTFMTNERSGVRMIEWVVEKAVGVGKLCRRIFGTRCRRLAAGGLTVCMMVSLLPASGLAAVMPDIQGGVLMGMT